MAKNYKTANGQDIDMERLILKNETTRAVGNMNVNARGDVVDSGNKVTSARSAQVNKNYRKQIGNVAQDTPVVSSKKAAEKLAEQTANEEPIAGLDEEKPAPVAVKEVTPVKAKTKSVKAKAKPAAKKAEGGLAAAIEKARKED